MRRARHEPLRLELVDQANDGRAIEPKNFAEPRLAKTRIGIDQRQDAELTWGNIGTIHRCREILEDRELRAPQMIADEIGQESKAGCGLVSLRALCRHGGEDAAARVQSTT